MGRRRAVTRRIWLLAGVAGLLAILKTSPVFAFAVEGHESIEAAAYKRLLVLDLVPGTRVSGRLLLATLIVEGVLHAPPCLALANDLVSCDRDSRLELPLAHWPVLGSGAVDLIINRQLNEQGQCQHFMAQTADSWSPPHPRFGVPRSMVTDAYRRCVIGAGRALEQILRDPRRTNLRLYGIYALMHAIEDSFSAAHARRDPEGKIVHLLSWTLIDWPGYFLHGRFSFPPDTHHALSDGRDADYLRADAHADDGQSCGALHNPYAIPESCLTERARMAVDAVVDLLVDVYRLRARAATEGRTASLSVPADSALWLGYVHAHLSSADGEAALPSDRPEGLPRPDLFLGVRTIARSGGWGLGLWAERVVLGPAVPFVMTVSGTAGFSRIDGDNHLGAIFQLGLVLPLIRRFAIGAMPVGASVECDTSFQACTADVVATVGNLIVPLGRQTWLGLEGPSWSWTSRTLGPMWAGLTFGWAHELSPGPDPPSRERMAAWDPPRPAEVHAFRGARGSLLIFVATTAASTADNQFIGGGLMWRRDRDRWNRRAGLSFGFQVEADRGAINGTSGGAATLSPTVRAYLRPDRLAVTAAPAMFQIGTVNGPGTDVDLAGRAGIAIDLGKVEVAVDSPPLSYLSSARWHALPISVRLGLLLDI